MDNELTLEQRILKRSLRQNYKQYINRIKKNDNLDSILLNEKRQALKLAFVFECHYFFMRDIEYNYNLFKKIYDIAFVNGFHEFNENRNLYDFLILNFNKKDSFDFQDWCMLIEFFKSIVEED